MNFNTAVRRGIGATVVVVASFIARPAAAQASDLGGLWRPVSATTSSKKPDTVVTAKAKDTVATPKALQKKDTVPTPKTLPTTDSVPQATRWRDSVMTAARIAADSIVTVRTAEQRAIAVKQADSIAAYRARLGEVAVVRAKIDSLQAAQKVAARQVADAEQRTAAKLSGLGNFRFSGDVRVRYEGQFQGGGFVTRNRERSRGRLGVSGSVTDDLSGAIAFATGSSDDVQSANQTQTGFFSRKTIGFDRFSVQWKPRGSHGFGVVAGKFAYPWERTSLTFGNDINPEGIAPSWTLTRKGVFQGATVVGFALPFLEVAGGKDSYAAGGQLQTRWKVSAHTAARVSVATVAFHGEDAIAQAITAGTIKPASPNTNRMTTDSAGKVNGYSVGYRYHDVIAALEYTPRPRLPLSVQVDVVQNTRARAGEKTGVWSEVKAGRLSQLHDVQAVWTLFRVERDAVIGAFNEQDLRAATNVINHKVTVAYQWRTNATVSVGSWFGHLIDPSATNKLATPYFKTACTTSPFTGCRDPWLSRVQIDLSYKF